MKCIKLDKYNGIEIPRPDITLDQKLFDAKILELREANVIERKKRKPAVVGDEIVLEMEAFDMAGNSLPYTKSKAYNAIIGRGDILSEIEPYLVGKEVLDKFDVNVVFPEEHEYYPGKEARFSIKVKELYSRKLPEVDDDFILELDVDGIETVEELNEFVKDVCLSEQRENIDKVLRENVLNHIINNSEFEFTEEEVLSKVTEISSKISTQVLYDGFSLEFYLNKLKLTYEEFLEKLRDNAIHEIKYYCVIDAIAEKEGLEPTDEDVRDGIEILSEQYDMAYEELVRTSESAMVGFKKDLKRKKVVDFVLTHLEYID